MSINVYRLWYDGLESSEDCTIAIQAAEAMMRRFQCDIAIMADLTTTPLHTVDLKRETPLEVVRYPKGRR